MKWFKNEVSSFATDLRSYFRADLLSGFLVSLIALPLCLGIAKASGFPAVTGIFTAIIGGLVVGILGGTHLTIKGPAAGLIVIVLGAVTEFGCAEGTGCSTVLGAIIVAGLLQVVFGVFKLGKFSDFFPSAVVHGMLAAIGLIIISKQSFVLMGIKPESKAPLDLMAELPTRIIDANPVITILGISCLMILFVLPLFKIKLFKLVPPPVWVLILSIPAAILLGINEISGSTVIIGRPFDSIIFPSFGLMGEFVFWKYVIMFALVGSLESLLTLKAVDLMDPLKRKANPNRDLTAVGVGNILSASIGGLPMIAEIARSSANIQNGGKSRWVNIFHGAFLLVFILLAQPVIEMIPNAALAAMLCFVGYKLASPKEFKHMYVIGKEQLLIFVTTLLVTLATDLLMGVAAGIMMEFFIDLINGVPFRKLFKSNISVENNAETGGIVVKILDCALFSNFIAIKKTILALPGKKHVKVDFSAARLVDHTVLENLDLIISDYNREEGQMEICGLENHRAFSAHALAARKIIRANIIQDPTSIRQ